MAVTFNVVDLSVDPEGTGAGVSFTVVTLGESGGGGGGGAVDSVNGEVGVVVLDAADVGADATGTATAAVAAHVAAADPHPGYLTSAEGDAAYDALGAAASAQSAAATDATNKVAAHEADTTSVHGIADTSALATTAAVAAGYQPLDSDLTAIAALTTTTFGRALLAMADAAATKTALSLTKGDVGLSNVDNTADASKPVSTAQQTALNLKANLASPALTGTPTAPTAAGGTNTTQLATTAFATAGISALSTVYQPLDSDLTSIAALSTTSFGRSVLALADAAALRSLAGLGTAAVLNSGTASGDIPLLSTGGVLPIARLASGTPDGTKFVRDDGTLVTPSGGGGATFVGCAAERTTNQAVASSTWVVVLLTAEVYDTDAIHDNSTNTGRFTIPTGKGGKWRFTATTVMDASGAGVRAYEWKKNGTALSARFGAVYRYPSPTYTTVNNMSVVLLLAAGDYIEHELYQESGTTRQIVEAYITAEFLG